MAEQTKRASNRRNSTASSRRRSSSNGRSGSRTKPRSSARGQSTASSLASKLKTPAIAGGAAVVGLAGGLALAGRGSHRKLLGLPLPAAAGSQATSRNLAEAAKRIGSFGMRVGELAAEARMVREATEHEHNRSPIEVVLQGLTSRRK